MTRATILFCSLIAFLIASATVQAAEKPKSWGSLEPGNHGVGFRVIHTYDNSRGYPGEPPEGQEPQGRPIQISMWYPAAENGPRMQYGEYLGLHIGRHDFLGVTEKDRKDMSLRIAESRIGKYGANVTPKQWVELETGAVRDAEAAAGNFPLILYAPGFSQPAFDNSLVCELLASHGYIVLASPSAGALSAGMTEDLEGIETQTRDLEFLVTFAQELPECDTEKIGAFGWSWGDIAVMLQQMRNSYIDAIISYDGSLEWNMEKVRQADNFDPDHLNVPYLYACHEGLKDITFEFFDGLTRPDAKKLHFNKLTHGEFGSYRAMIHNGFPENYDYDPRSYEALCQYTLHFFEAHLRGVDESDVFLKQSPEQNGIAVGLADGSCAPAR